MKTEQIVSEFEKNWILTRQLTIDFAEAIPAAHWDFTFNPKYSPLCKQLRHMIWVTGLYTSALENQVLDYKTKKISYSGGLSQEEILPALKNSDQNLKKWLAEAKEKDLSDFRVKAFGGEMGFSEFSHILIEHEANHHGLWSAYASLAGFKTPQSWDDSWGL